MSTFDTLMDTYKSGIKDLLSPLKFLLDIFSNFWISLGFISIVFISLLLYCIIIRKDKFREHLKHPDVLAICSLMMALNIVLGYFTIQFSAYLRIGFGFMTQPIIAIFFGPLVACVTGIIQDIISLLLRPTGPYNPIYSLSIGISAIMYGMMLYKKNPSFMRILLTKLLVIIVGNIIFNSIALAPTVGSGLIGILPSRLLKNIILFPIQTVIVYIVLKFVKKLKYTKKFDA